jgi:hypothetical protein
VRGVRLGSSGSASGRIHKDEKILIYIRIKGGPLRGGIPKHCARDSRGKPVLGEVVDRVGLCSGTGASPMIYGASNIN